MGRGEGQQYIREVVKGKVGYMEPEVESKQAKREEARESGGRYRRDRGTKGKRLEDKEDRCWEK